MRNLLSTFKPLALGLAVIGILTLGQSAAKADEVFLSGSTAGCFGAACAPGASATILGIDLYQFHFRWYYGGWLPGLEHGGQRAERGQPGLIHLDHCTERLQHSVYLAGDLHGASGHHRLKSGHVYGNSNGHGYQ